MKAEKLKMQPNCKNTGGLLEIDEIYITESQKDGFYKKEDIHEHLKKWPGSIQVGRYPYPDLIPAVSVYGEKYVKSKPDATCTDNLLSLPRE